MAVAGAKKERGREKKSRIKSNAGVTMGTRKGKSAAYGPNVQLFKFSSSNTLYKYIHIYICLRVTNPMCKLAEDSFQGPSCPQVLSGPVCRCKHNAGLSTNCDSVSALWNDKASQK